MLKSFTVVAVVIASCTTAMAQTVRTPVAPAAAAADMQKLQMAIVAQQQVAMKYMNDLAPIMPALMRSQRVGMLAMMKSCGWATGVGLYPGLVPPR